MAAGTESGDGARVRDVAIIGAGFSGIGMAIALKRRGIHDFVVLERAEGLGGTWRDNAYPGAGCDTRSILYSYSFNQNPHWSRTYAGQAEILDYLRATSAKYGVDPHIRYSYAVKSAAFDPERAVWRVVDADGAAIECRFLVSAVGQLSRPSIPRIEGRELFAGPAFHSSQWRHDVELAGKRVAVLGTGASAIQFVPAIAPEVDRLLLFQRSPAWVVPKDDFEVPERTRWIYAHVPLAQRLERVRRFFQAERTSLRYRIGTKLNDATARAGLGALHRAVSDPERVALLTPDYLPGCKRLLRSNHWYPAMARENVDIVSSPIARITPAGIVTADGREHPVDVIIYGTGFHATEFLVPMEITGPDGRTLHETWGGEARAYLGMQAPGFPNFFMMYGPNTNTHNSVVFMLETQARYISRRIRKMLSRGIRSAGVRPAAIEAFDRWLTRQFKKFVWTTGCHNWYMTASGRVTNMWPSFSSVYWLATLLPDGRRHHWQRSAEEGCRTGRDDRPAGRRDRGEG